MAVFPGLKGLLPTSGELERLARAVSPMLSSASRPGHDGLIASRKAGHSLDFLDYRDYQPQDDARHIDWRRSKDLQHLQLRRFQDQRASDWSICLDGSASMAVNNGEKWLQAARLASALSYLLLELGHRVNLIQFSADIDRICPAGRGRRQQALIVRDLLRRSGESAGRGSNPGSCRQKLGRANPVIVISDCLQEDGMQSQLQQLWHPQRSMHLLMVQCAGDVILPANSELTLQDCETGRTRPVYPQQDLMPSAQRELAHIEKTLEDYCRSRGILFLPAPSETHWSQLLLRLYGVSSAA